MGEIDLCTRGLFRTTFTWSFFWCDAYFWQQWIPKWIQFSFSLHYKIRLSIKIELQKIKINARYKNWIILEKTWNQIENLLKWCRPIHWIEHLYLGENNTTNRASYNYLFLGFLRHCYNFTISSSLYLLHLKDK